MTKATRDAYGRLPSNRPEVPVPPQFLLAVVMGWDLCAGIGPTCKDPLQGVLMTMIHDTRHGKLTDPKYHDQFVELRIIRMEVRRARRKAGLL